MSYFSDRSDVRAARARAEVKWLDHEPQLIDEVFAAANKNELDRAERLKNLISTSPVSGTSPFKDESANSGPPDAESPHEKFLDKWRIAVTAALVLSLLLIVILVIVDGPTSTTKNGVTTTSGADVAPYISLFSGIAGIALGWMFAQATGIGQRNQNPGDGKDGDGGGGGGEKAGGGANNGVKVDATPGNPTTGATETKPANESDPEKKKTDVKTKNSTAPNLSS